MPIVICDYCGEIEEIEIAEIEGWDIQAYDEWRDEWHGACPLCQMTKRDVIEEEMRLVV